VNNKLPLIIIGHIDILHLLKTKSLKNMYVYEVDRNCEQTRNIRIPMEIL